MSRPMLSGVSVVIPLYNKVGTIARAIDSALQQHGVDVQVVVVDDGSTDGSTEVAKRYGERVTLIQQRNAGPSAARNRGVKESRHSVVAFLDADDQYLAGFLREHMRCRESRSGPKVTLGSFRVIGRDGRCRDEILTDRVPELKEMGGFHYADAFHARLAINVHIGCVAVEKTLFEAIGGFDERLVSWEISDFMLRLLLSAPETVVLNGIYLNVYETAASQSTLTHGSPRYLQLFAEKLVDLFESVPSSERSFIARQLRAFVHALWASGAISEFKQVSLRATPLLKEYGCSGKLELAARLPAFALRTLRYLPRIG